MPLRAQGWPAGWQGRGCAVVLCLTGRSALQLRMGLVCKLIIWQRWPLLTRRAARGLVLELTCVGDEIVKVHRCDAAAGQMGAL